MQTLLLLPPLLLRRHCHWQPKSAAVSEAAAAAAGQTEAQQTTIKFFCCTGLMKVKNERVELHLPELWCALLFNDPVEGLSDFQLLYTRLLYSQDCLQPLLHLCTGHVLAISD